MRADREVIKIKVVSIVESIIKEQLNNHDSMLDSELLDSLKTIILVTELENEFSIQIPPEEFSYQNFNSADAIVDLIQSL